jgi:hypothetical protein
MELSNGYLINCISLVRNSNKHKTSKKLLALKKIHSVTLLKSFFGVASGIMILLSCASSEKNKKKESVNVSYEVAKGYFVKNTVSIQQPTSVIVANKEALDSILGMAATMGANGKPTDFDFSREYGIVFIYPETDSSVVLNPGILALRADTARLSVSIDLGVKQTYRIVPFLLLKVTGTAPTFVVRESNQ